MKYIICTVATCIMTQSHHHTMLCSTRNGNWRGSERGQSKH
jgi:hypothetical protein